MASNDPRFEEKTADIIGLYMKPAQRAAVFCVDEESAIQVLDRLDAVLPLSPDRAERHGFEYYRHGTLSLYAALDVRTGKVVGKTAARHTSAEFVDFLGKTVEEFLQVHPKVRFHFMPTYSAWLDHVGIFPRPNAMSLRGECSPPWPNLAVDCANTFALTASRPNRFAGPIATPVAESGYWRRYERDSPQGL